MLQGSAVETGVGRECSKAKTYDLRDWYSPRRDESDKILEVLLRTTLKPEISCGSEAKSGRGRDVTISAYILQDKGNRIYSCGKAVGLYS